MLLQTILNRVQRHKSFVYKKAWLVEKKGRPAIEVKIVPRTNTRPICSGCGRAGPGYDKDPEPRRFDFVPLWGMAVIFLYAMRRVNCRSCGVKVERVPWAEGKNHLTTTYQCFLAQWAKLLSWKQVARSFRTTWDNVFRSVKMVVSWGLEHRSLDGIEAIGVDEVQWQKDRFHIMKLLNKAIDKTRAGEAKRLKADGLQPVLKNSRWVWLKRVWNLTRNQRVKLKELLKYNLQTVRAYLLKEEFHHFWEYRSAGCAKRFLKRWCTRVLHSRIEPMKKVARTLRTHEGLILNWFRAKGTMSSGVVEGLNYNVKLSMRKAYGFRTYDGAEVALYHKLGKLPEPKLAHGFC